MDFKKILFKSSSIDVDKSLPDGVIFIDKDGKIQWVNDVASDLFETSKMHLMTSNISDFIENAMSLIQNASLNNKPVIVKFNTQETYYDLTAREINEGFVLDLRDAADNSDTIKISDENSAVNREKNNFLIKLSNDLKSPIQSIVGFSQAMSDGLGGNMSEQQEKYVKIINKNSTELMYFIGKLLELSQTEIGFKQPEKKPFDALALVNSVIKYNEQLYKNKDIKISVITEENYKKMISTDAEIYKSILQDIFEIIIKSVDMGEIKIILSTPDSDEVESKGLVHGQYTKCSVCSSALLLTENDLDCMFDPYKILDSVNRKNVLRAIVLASVKNLVKSLGGIVWVESQILKNTSFNIIIPAD